MAEDDPEPTIQDVGNGVIEMLPNDDKIGKQTAAVTVKRESDSEEEETQIISGMDLTGTK